MGLIAKALRPLLQLWVRSQLTTVEALKIRVVAGDREFLQGQLQKIELQAITAVYQGLQLGRATLVAERIFLQWQPVVQLRAPLVAKLQVELTPEDLAASLASPLLESGLADLLVRAFGQNPLAGRATTWETARLDANAIVLTSRDARLELGLATVAAAKDNFLRLAPVRLQLGDRCLEADAVAFDLGDGAIECWAIAGDRLQLRGQVAIRPIASTSAGPSHTRPE